MYKRMLAQHGEIYANGWKGIDVAEQMWVTKDFQPVRPIQQKQVDSWFCISYHAKHPQISLSLYKIGFQTSHL